MSDMRLLSDSYSRGEQRAAVRCSSTRRPSGDTVTGMPVLCAPHKRYQGSLEALRVYRDKDYVEKCFDDLKNQLDMKRLRIHTSSTMDGRLFVQFIASIYMSALRKKMRDSGLTEKYTVRELLLEMETLIQVRYSGKYGHILTEVTKPQRQIMESLGVDPEHSYNSSGI